MTLPTRDEIREATRTDVEWRPIPGFDLEYDAGSHGVIRRRTTNSIVKNVGNKCQVRHNDGRWTTRAHNKLVNWAFDPDYWPASWTE